MAKGNWIILGMLIVLNICKQYLSCTVKWRHLFDVIEDVNVKRCIPAVCRNQHVGDANLGQNSRFMIIFL